MCAENIVGNRVSDLYCVLGRIFYTNQSSYTHAALGNNFYAPVWKNRYAYIIIQQAFIAIMHCSKMVLHT